MGGREDARILPSSDCRLAQASLCTISAVDGAAPRAGSLPAGATRGCLAAHKRESQMHRVACTQPCRPCTCSPSSSPQRTQQPRSPPALCTRRPCTRGPPTPGTRHPITCIPRSSPRHTQRPSSPSAPRTRYPSTRQPGTLSPHRLHSNHNPPLQPRDARPKRLEPTSLVVLGHSVLTTLTTTIQYDLIPPRCAASPQTPARTNSPHKTATPDRSPLSTTSPYTYSGCSCHTGTSLCPPH